MGKDSIDNSYSEYSICAKSQSPMSSMIQQIVSIRSLFTKQLRHLLLGDLCVMSRLITVNDALKTDLTVDLGHALVISKGSSFRSKDDVLQQSVAVILKLEGYIPSLRVTVAWSLERQTR